MEPIKTNLPIIKEETISLDTKKKLLIVGKKSYILEKGVTNLLEALMYENTVLKEYIEITKGIDTDIWA